MTNDSMITLVNALKKNQEEGGDVFYTFDYETWEKCQWGIIEADAEGFMNFSKKAQELWKKYQNKEIEFSTGEEWKREKNPSIALIGKLVKRGYKIRPFLEIDKNEEVNENSLYLLCWFTDCENYYISNDILTIYYVQNVKKVVITHNSGEVIETDVRTLGELETLCKVLKIKFDNR